MIKTKTVCIYCILLARTSPAVGRLGEPSGSESLPALLPLLPKCLRVLEPKDFLLSCLRLKRSRRWRTSRDTLDPRGNGSASLTVDPRIPPMLAKVGLILSVTVSAGVKNLHWIYFKTQVLP